MRIMIPIVQNGCTDKLQRAATWCSFVHVYKLQEVTMGPKACLCDITGVR